MSETFEEFCNYIEITKINEEFRYSYWGKDYLKMAWDYQQKKIDQLQKENEELKEAYREIPICKCSSWADVHVIDKSIKTNNHHRKCEQYKEQEGE